MTSDIFRETLQAWNTKAEDNIVPGNKVQELFYELKFYPTDKQVNDMLQTAKQFSRRCVNCAGVATSSTTSTKQYVNNNNNAASSSVNGISASGLTLGEFCVLASDLRKFRTFSTTQSHDNLENENDGIRSSSLKQEITEPTNLKINKIKNRLPGGSSSINLKENDLIATATTSITQNNLSSTDTGSNNSTDTTAPEVFLGGSCNPTTWRADVAIPTLNQLGISFYNPQVSDWTPDLIELEHRAKEKARVLFFVMDSETRASAGAIEAAHIAGQNARHLVLVLHPYKQNQSILNEPISSQEYLDLTRNQQLLIELVKRRGLPVLDSIASGLQRTKAILTGYSGRDPPQNIASRLISVRRAFDRVVGTKDDAITLFQCQIALGCLGYPNNLIIKDNLKRIVCILRDMQQTKIATPITPGSVITDEPTISETLASSDVVYRIKRSNSSEGGSGFNFTQHRHSNSRISLNFEEFCLIASYLSILQQEINENSCASPIKGTNVPPPPIFLTNMPEWIHNQMANEDLATPPVGGSALSRPSSGRNILMDRSKKLSEDGNNVSVGHDNHYFNRDSGTSSPQPGIMHSLSCEKKSKVSINVENVDQQNLLNESRRRVTERQESAHDVDSDNDSNDSVFSSGASGDESDCSDSGVEIRDIYLGGSCMMRTRWRQESAIPILKTKGITYFLPTLHESISTKSLIFTSQTSEEAAGSTSGNFTATLPQAASVNHNLIKRIKRKKSNCADRLQLANCGVNDGIPVASTNSETTSQENLPTLPPLSIPNTNYPLLRRPMFHSTLLDSSRVLLFVITNETRSLAPMTLAAHYIGLGYNVVLCVQMLPDNCILGTETLTPAAIKDYNRGRSYLIDLAKRQGIPVFSELHSAIDCAIEKAEICKSRIIRT